MLMIRTFNWQESFAESTFAPCGAEGGAGANILLWWSSSSIIILADNDVDYGDDDVDVGEDLDLDDHDRNQFCNWALFAIMIREAAEILILRRLLAPSNFYPLLIYLNNCHPTALFYPQFMKKLLSELCGKTDQLMTRIPLTHHRHWLSPPVSLAQVNLFIFHRDDLYFYHYIAVRSSHWWSPSVWRPHGDYLDYLHDHDQLL